ncbi:MAG: MazG nucleotide pyrophosphohydrolase domain-containing protein [Candidatus Latescibacterota bacterium]
MTIRESQECTRQRDSATRWHAVSPLQIMAHLTEELGEVAQAVDRTYEHRGAEAARHRASLGAELVDVLWFLAKLATRFDVDLEGGVCARVERAAARQEDWHHRELVAAVESLAADAARARRLLDAAA